ncbi:MAG: hypothetical protein IT369_19345 [Candidatus Latescibacteria bacterium]|nr:hypothetical protein [Candidatus Latescibacterota bacterium]
MTQPICKNLRTKKSYIPAYQDQDYLTREHPHAQYFCLKTLHVIGKDDDIVSPGACGEGRGCFTPLLMPVPA